MRTIGPMRAAAVAVAIAVGSFASGCGPGSGDDADDGTVNPVVALAVSPASVTLESVDQMPVSQAFTVRATYLDGTIGDVTAQVAWSISGPFGGFSGATFTATGMVGGVATATAALDAAQGTAAITINIRGTRVDPSAPPN